MAHELPVLIDPALGVDPADPDARQLGRLEARPSAQQYAGLLELVVIPLAVGVAANVTSDLITEAIKRLMAGKVKGPVAVEKQTLPGGQEAVVAQKG
jgi:hypothetical protein